MRWRRAIDKITWTWKEAVKTKELAEDVIREYGDHMKPGIWEIHFTDKAWLIRVPGKGMDFYYTHLQHYRRESRRQSIVRVYLQNLFSKKWRYQCSGEGSNVLQADCVLFSRDGSANLFDLGQGVVEKSHNANDKKGYLMLQDAGYWDVFHSPVLNIEEGFTHERIIAKFTNDIGDKERFKNIIGNYRKYFKAVQPVERHTIEEIISPYTDFIPNYDRVVPLNIRKLSLNFYVQHGDFTWENTFFDQAGDLYIIDYELVGVLPFFQDILYFATYKVGIGQRDWQIVDALMDNTTEIGQLFDEILSLQGIPRNKEVKLVLLLLTRIRFYVRFIDEQFWNERNVPEVIREREKNMVEMLVRRYATDV